SSDSWYIYTEEFVGQGHCKDVVAYPLYRASVCTSCSSVPDFVVPLSSLYSSRKTSLRLTNRLHQLACKGLAPSGIIWYLGYQMPILGTHNEYKNIGRTVVSASFRLLTKF